VVGHFDDPHTGAERSMPDLAQALQGLRKVALWSDGPVHPYFAARGVHQIVDGDQRVAADGGMLLISGVHVALGAWLEGLRPDRVVLRYNLPDHQRLFDAIVRIRAATGLDPELVFVSAIMQSSVGLPGRVEPSLIRLDSFLEGPVERHHGVTVTVGRMSRDAIGKHDPQDIAIYRMLAARGMRVRIMGGTCLKPWLAGVAGVALLPSGEEPAADFLRSLDIFFYRTGSFVEPYGRVVLEAMASGLPVVASGSGGYAEQMENGVDGVIFQSQEQALQALRLLADQPDMRHLLGSAARQRAIALHGPQAVARLVRNYCV
jgi:glycosyltransferase involved in cell wall biosynthesis